MAYPNILHLEKPGLLGHAIKNPIKRAQLKDSTLDLFKIFFQQVSGNDMNKEQSDALVQAIQISQQIPD